jgi:hypothetical protein
MTKLVESEERFLKNPSIRNARLFSAHLNSYEKRGKEYFSKIDQEYVDIRFNGIKSYFYDKDFPKEDVDYLKALWESN